VTDAEPGWLRRAGRGRLADGRTVLWSVAEGGRGRRWRWVYQEHQAFVGTVGLVERLPDGRFGRLELAAYGGLLTFHPDSDGRAAHGNIVTAERVQPIEAPWQPEWGVGIVGDPFGSTVGGWVGSGLAISWMQGAIMWRDPGSYADVEIVATDSRGVPQLVDADEWPLED
jgi:hypothetical protein